MSLRVWALKLGELKPLSRGGLLLLSLRCAMRVEPWLPQGIDALWSKGLEYVVGAAFDKPNLSKRAMRLARDLSDKGAIACNRLMETDEPLGRCMSYATSTLAAAIEATGLDGPELKKAVIHSSKLSASIPAILAHAKRILASAGEDPVDAACVAIWSAIRADIPAVDATTPDIEVAKHRVDTLRRCSPFWVGRTPSWAS